MNADDTSNNDSNDLNPSEETTIIDSLADLLNDEVNILTNQKALNDFVYQNNPAVVAVPIEEDLTPKYENLNPNDSDLESINGKIYTCLHSIEFENQKIEAPENQDDSPFIVIEVQNHDIKDEMRYHTNDDHDHLMSDNQNFSEEVYIPSYSADLNESNISHEAIFSSTQVSENINENKSDQETSKPNLQLSNNNHYILRERLGKRKRKARTSLLTWKKCRFVSNNSKKKSISKKTEKTNSKVKVKEEESKIKVQTKKMIMNKNAFHSECENVFVKPITPRKYYNTRRHNKSLNNREQNILQPSSANSVLGRNLTDEEKMVLNSSHDTISNSDNEFEQICNFMKNDNYDPAQLSFDTLDLLNEFQDIDQSTNENLLADLLNSPRRTANHNQEDVKATIINSPVVEENFEDSNSLPIPSGSGAISDKDPEIEMEKYTIFPTSLENEVSSSEESINIENRPIILEYRSLNKENYSSGDEDDEDYNLSSLHDSRASSPEIDMEDIKKKAEKAGRSFVIGKHLLEKMRSFTVKLEHEIPIQHELEKAICTPPTAKISVLFEQYTPLKKGFYSKDEDDIIKKNWQHFCEVHNWCPTNVKPFLQLRYRGKPILVPSEAIKFAQFLAQGLPSRSLYSVIWRFRILFRVDIDKKSQSKGNYYTPEEDKIIWEYFKDQKINPRDKVRKLAKLLSRPTASISYRLQKLRKEKIEKLPSSSVKIKKSVTWDTPLVEKFIKELMTLTLSEDVKELKDAIIPLIIWEMLEKELKISKITLRNFWMYKLHAQLFYPRPFFLNDVKVLLIEYMYVKGITNRAELNWLKISEYFDGITIKYLMKIFNNLVKDCNLTNKSDFGEIIQTLYENKIKSMKFLRREKYLPGLVYKNGKIEVVDKSTFEELHCDENNLSEESS